MTHQAQIGGSVESGDHSLQVILCVHSFSLHSHCIGCYNIDYRCFWIHFMQWETRMSHSFPTSAWKLPPHLSLWLLMRSTFPIICFLPLLGSSSARQMHSCWLWQCRKMGDSEQRGQHLLLWKMACYFSSISLRAGRAQQPQQISSRCI